jgi:hypothetical protein
MDGEVPAVEARIGRTQLRVNVAETERADEERVIVR